LTDNDGYYKTGRIIYGSMPEGNSIGKVVEIWDQSGKTFTKKYDFKGNLLSLQRKLAVDYKDVLDWSQSVKLEKDEFVQLFEYDAMFNETGFWQQKA